MELRHRKTGNLSKVQQFTCHLGRIWTQASWLHSYRWRRLRWSSRARWQIGSDEELPGFVSGSSGSPKVWGPLPLVELGLARALCSPFHGSSGSPKVWGPLRLMELGPARALCGPSHAAAAWPRQSSHLSFLLLSTFLNEEGCSALRTYKWLALTCQAWSLYFTRPIMNAIFLSKICIPPFLKSNDSNFFPSAHFLSVSFNGTCETDRRRDEKWKRAVD